MEKNYHMFVYILSFYLHNDIAHKSCYDLHSTSEETHEQRPYFAWDYLANKWFEIVTRLEAFGAI